MKARDTEANCHGLVAELQSMNMNSKKKSGLSMYKVR